VLAILVASVRMGREEGGSPNADAPVKSSSREGGLDPSTGDPIRAAAVATTMPLASAARQGDPSAGGRGALDGGPQLPELPAWPEPIARDERGNPYVRGEAADLERLFALSPGMETSLSLPGGLDFEVTVRNRSVGESSVAMGLDFADGVIALSREAPGAYRGHVIWNGHPEAHAISPEPDEQVRVTRQLAKELLCASWDSARGLRIGMPPPKNEDRDPPEESESIRADGQISASPPLLDSLPTASAVVYLDFDGETVTGTLWNSQLTNGNPIVALPSTLSQAAMTGVWKRVSSDLAPFNISVTTIESRYLNAPPNRRIRVIITPSSEWLGNWGGVAYLNSFTWTGDTPCWTFENNVGYTEKNVANVTSHEIGHTFGLHHDGLNVEGEDGEYYWGHGSGATSWAPIMGAGYSRTIVQWSKGEYFNANRTEDDLAIIAGAGNGFGYRVDQHGGTIASASPIPVNTDTGQVDASGIIETTSDADVFRISPANGQISLTVSTTGPPGHTESPSPTLDLRVELLDAAGNVIQTSNPAGTGDASVSHPVSGGTYYLRISGSGFGDPLSSNPTGYTDYASLGRYWISGSFPTKYDQTITFDPIPTQSAPVPLALAATGGGSGNPVVFTLDSGPATLVGNTLTFTGAGTVSVTANQAGNSNHFDAAPVTRVFEVALASQSLTFAAIGTRFAHLPHTLSATGGPSGNPVVFTLDSGPATLAGNALTFTGAGTVSVTASLAGNALYGAATPVTRVFDVVRGPQPITFPLPSTQSVLDTVNLITLGGSPHIAPVFELLSGPGSISGTTLSFTGEGLVELRAFKPGNALYEPSAWVPGSVTVANPAQVINFPVIPSKRVTDSLQLSATGGGSGNPVVLTVTTGIGTAVSAEVAAALPGTGTLTFIGPGTVSVTANQAGDGFYTAAAPVSRSFSVTKAPVAITLSNLAQTFDGTDRSVSVTTDPPGVSFTVTYNGSPVVPVGAGTYHINVTVDDPLYQGTRTASLTVAPIPGSIELSGLVQRFDGTPKTPFAATDPPGEEVVFTYNGQPGPPSAGGFHRVVATFASPNYQGHAEADFLINRDPVLRVAGGKSIRASSARQRLRGSASDPDGDLSEVRFIDSRPRGRKTWRRARGSARWSATVPLRPGRNAVRFQAVDRHGGSSRIEQVRILYR